MQLQNCTEYVIRDLYSADGQLVANNAVIERRVTETLLGMHGVLTGDVATLMPIAAIKDGTVSLYRAKNVTYVIYHLRKIPIDAHFDIMSEGAGKQSLFSHLSINTSLPRAKFDAYDNAYDFFLIISNPNEGASYLLIRDKMNRTLHATGLPNTWDTDAKACLGRDLDSLIMDKGIMATNDIYKKWLGGQYNNHLKPDVTINMREFWKFDLMGNWKPNPRAIMPPYTGQWAGILGKHPHLPQ